MLQKLTAALNPFFTERANHDIKPEAEAPKAAHKHSFSCPCKACVDETNRLTRERLKAQGA